MSIRRKKVADDIRHLVLVVDDEQINRELLGFILSSEYDVLYASDGQEALDRIHEHRSMLSLVLLDLKMPVMDGFAVLDRMREEQLLSKLPVIVLTSEKQAEVQSLRAGAVDFITKPYDLPEVILARAQLEKLKDLGCDIVQGYYFSKPVPPEEFEKLITPDSGRPA